MTNELTQPFEISDALRKRFMRAENKANTSLSVQMHRPGVRVPATQATLSTAPIPETYLVRVGLDGAAAIFPFEQVAFNTTQPNRAYDAITAANYGTYHESVQHIDGPIVYEPPATGRAIRTTVNDSVVAGSPIGIGSGSWETWLRTSETVGAPTLLGHIEATTGFLKILLNADGSLTAAKTDDTDFLLYDDDNTEIVNDGDWHHVVIVDTGSALTLYVDET